MGRMRGRSARIWPYLLAGCLPAILAATAVPAQTGGPSAAGYLIRQDFSDCQNGNVSDRDPSLIGGTIAAVKNPNGTTSLKIGITAKPNTVYNFYLKCVRQLGTIKTYDEGEGEAIFDFPSDQAGPIITFDMYPDGAPAGNKYQSTQLKF